jgi:hypothetical protein
MWNKQEFPDRLKESIIVPIHKMGDKTDFNNYSGISMLSNSYKIVSNILLSRLTLFGTFSVDFDVTDQLLIRFFAFIRYWKKCGSTVRQYFQESL